MRGNRRRWAAACIGALALLGCGSGEGEELLARGDPAAQGDELRLTELAGAGGRSELALNMIELPEGPHAELSRSFALAPAQDLRLRLEPGFTSVSVGCVQRDLDIAFEWQELPGASRRLGPGEVFVVTAGGSYRLTARIRGVSRCLALSLGFAVQVLPP